MTNHNRAHLVCERSLPRIILVHTARGAPLNHRYRVGMRSMDSLPRVATKVVLDSLRINRALQHFRQGYRRDPELSRGVAAEPFMREASLARCDLVQQIDQEGGIEKAGFHLREMRNRESPIRPAASARTSAPVMKGSSRMR